MRHPGAAQRRASRGWISGERAGPARLARTRELEADLLFMSGRGRSQMRERIFGRVTRHLLDHDDSSVLIAH